MHKPFPRLTPKSVLPAVIKRGIVYVLVFPSGYYNVRIHNNVNPLVKQTFE